MDTEKRGLHVLIVLSDFVIMELFRYTLTLSFIIARLQTTYDGFCRLK